MFHHNFGTPNAHTHPFIDPVTGAPSLTFTIPNDNEIESTVFYRVHLTVTDSGGASTEVTRDLLPRTSQITLATNPPGLQLLRDDSPVTPPVTVTSVEGIQRRIEAPSPQVVGGTTYVFQGWSDGGAAQHTITTPTNDTTYTATYVPATGSASALFVTGDPSTLGTDQTVIDRLSQQLGFVVTVIDDDLVQASSTVGKNIVLVSSTVDSVAVANKLRDVTVPVMIWKPTLYDNMLMTGTVSGTDNGTIGGFSTVDIQAVNHPLAPNGAESLTIMNVNSTLPWGLPVGGGDTVGKTSTRATLFTYSPGDLMLGGVSAPACRIAFPLYNQAISRYTAVGWDLFDRTVEWATGGCGAQAPLAITQHPMSTTVGTGQSATFSVSATGTPPITYQWQRNSVDIPGATASSYTLSNAQASDSGAVFRVRVTDPSGTLTSNPATLTVQTTKRALYVAGNVAALGTDQTVINRLTQQLGFTVTVVDDAAATTASANGMNLVLISSTVDSVSVANKFRNVAVPVMIWKPSLYDNMLMTGTVSNTDFGSITGFRTVDIQAIAHPLAPNGAQTLTIMSVNKTIPFGVPVASGDIVGRTNARATLFTFSPGDVLRTGVIAPGCRVAFPIFNNGVAQYTAVGWDLFERTVNWATGGCSAP